MLNNILALLHPFIPFVTDEIYESINGETIYNASWPSVNEMTNETQVAQMDKIINIIQTMREVRVEYDLKPSLDLETVIVNHKNQQVVFSPLEKEILHSLARVIIIEELEGKP